MKDAGATRRTPSFTDRILFQAYPTDIQSMLYIFKYNEIDYIRDSDHSPVYGATSLRIGPNANKGHIFKKVFVFVFMFNRLFLLFLGKLCLNLLWKILCLEYSSITVV